MTRARTGRGRAAIGGLVAVVAVASWLALPSCVGVDREGGPGASGAEPAAASGASVRGSSVPESVSVSHPRCRPGDEAFVEVLVRVLSPGEVALKVDYAFSDPSIDVRDVIDGPVRHLTRELGPGSHTFRFPIRVRPDAPVGDGLRMSIIVFTESRAITADVEIPGG